MVSRIQNRNTGYSENLFSHNSRADNNTLSSIDGATALKLDQSLQLNEEEQSDSFRNLENELENENLSGIDVDQIPNNIPTGVSIESASYIENNNLEENNDKLEISENNNDEEFTPKLFSDEQSYQTEEHNLESDQKENENSEQLFDQDLNEDEDFEIPAFLRKQKF
jgi:hypothetical protein